MRSNSALDATAESHSNVGNREVTSKACTAFDTSFKPAFDSERHRRYRHRTRAGQFVRSSSRLAAVNCDRSMDATASDPSVNCRIIWRTAMRAYEPTLTSSEGVFLAPCLQ